jgi:glycosyltransferase involved in cell wall biosynthesis
MRKILYSIPNFTTAGSGRALLNIVARLNREKFSPMVCVLKKGGALEKELAAMDVPLLEAPFTVKALPYHKLPFRAWKASRFFHPYSIDLWHSFHYLDDYTEPVIARMAGAKAWIYTKKNMNWNGRSWFLRSLFASKIAAQNTDMLRDFFSGWAFRKKTRLIHRGVDVNKFSPNAQRGERPQREPGCDETVVGTVSHMVPVKGHPTLLRAFSKLPGKTKLLIAGKPMDAKYHKELISLTRTLGLEQRVTFVGNVSDVPAFLADLDIFVLPTWDKWRREGCPVALLEAMASGLPCVATSIPGSKDIIQDGVNGMLVPPSDADALSRALNGLLKEKSLRLRFGREARQTAVSSLSIEREVRRHEDMYNSL